jgi:hypothetical protein
MGSGSNTVTTNQSQQYKPNQPIQGMGNTAGQMATTAAQAPFQMPVAPVAGFNPFQQQGFGETLGLQGMAQPYFNTAGNYLAGSAAPITGADVSQYYNPMASNVFSQMQNIFGQQMRETTGNATQQAGGVGADRIGVAQANLANQQGLAAGQTASQLYQQALQAAEQQKQMQAGAGYGFGQMGPAAQAAQQNAINQLLGVGGQQQQLSQAQMNAQYQNQLAQIAYPFQTAQYLSGITGGLAPAMGGQTTGQATTTYPQPSMMSQILGGVTAGAGLFGAAGQAGMFNSPSYGGGSIFSGDAYGGSANNPLPGLTAADYGARGGKVGFADGGNVVPFPSRTALLGKELAQSPDQVAQNRTSRILSQVLGRQNVLPIGPDDKADGGGTDYGMLARRAEMHELGNILPSAEAGNPLASTVLHDIGGSLPMQGGGLADSLGGMSLKNFVNPFITGDFKDNPMTTMGLLGALEKQNPGGALGILGGGQQGQLGKEDQGGLGNVQSLLRSIGMQDGGDVPTGPTFPGSSPPHIGGMTPIPSMQLQPGAGKSGPYGQFMMMQTPSMGGQGQSGGSGGSGGMGQAVSMAANILPMLAMMKEGGIVNPFAAGEGYQDGGGEDTDINTYNDQSLPMWKRVGLQSDPDALPSEITGGKSQPDPNDPRFVGGPSHVGFADESPTGGFQGRPQPSPFGGGSSPYAMPPSQAPYPEATQRDWGQNATRSPWMALVKAGAQMMQTRGPIGSVIGAGLSAGAGELEGQRKELRSEEDINMKAQQLAQQAQFHADEFNKMKPHERESLDIQKQKLAIERGYKEFEESKPQSVYDPFMGPRPILRDSKGVWRYIDTQEPVIGPQVPSPSSSTEQPTRLAGDEPVGGDETGRPFKNTPATLATAMKAQEMGLHGQALLDALPANRRNTLEAVAFYDAPLSDFTKAGRLGMSQDQALNWVRQINPLYNQNWYNVQGQGFKNFFTGTQQSSPNIQSRTYNTAIGHAGELAEAIKQLQTSDPGVFDEARKAGVPFLSYLAANAQQRMARGTPAGEAWTRIGAILPLYGAETERFYAQTQGSETGRQAIQAPFNPNLSFKEMMGALYQQKEMYKSKTAPLEQEYQNIVEAPGVREYGPHDNPSKQWHVARQGAIQANDTIDRIYREAGGTPKGADNAPPQSRKLYDGHYYIRGPKGEAVLDPDQRP